MNVMKSLEILRQFNSYKPVKHLRFEEAVKMLVIFKDDPQGELENEIDSIFVGFETTELEEAAESVNPSNSQFFELVVTMMESSDHEELEYWKDLIVEIKKYGLQDGLRLKSMLDQMYSVLQDMSDGYADGAVELSSYYNYKFSYSRCFEYLEEQASSFEELNYYLLVRNQFDKKFSYEAHSCYDLTRKLEDATGEDFDSATVLLSKAEVMY